MTAPDSDARTIDVDDHAGPDAGPVVARIGRYVVLERVGSGGVGIVYAAWDPVLSRRVALKLLRSEGGDEAQQRLVREAQAMARLSHPHVVQVFDAGIADGRAFVAMDFVDGGTLRAWLKDPRPRDEVLDTFLQTARGLAAAHAASLVHRDFKPDNVLLGRLPDGRPRAMVADFGLVQVGTEDASAVVDAPAAAEHLSTGPVSNPARLTSTGAVMGTPAYMAPEQFLGRTVDARTDQFAFCVALYEALFGARPFAGEGARSLALAVMHGERAPIPPGSDVPTPLLRVVERGLATDPDRRHPSMDALVDALTRVRMRRRLGRVVAIALPVALGVTWAALPTEEPAATPCADVDAPIATRWTEKERAAVGEAFARTKLDYAEEAAAVAVRELDDWSRQWASTRRDACEATSVRAEQSAELLDLRMACLDRKLAGFSATIEILAAADRAAVERATSVATHLPDLRPCSDTTSLLAPIAPPDASQLGQVAELRNAIDRARAEVTLGRAATACPTLADLSARAAALGYLPLRAEAELARGACAVEASGADAREALEDALMLAIEARDGATASEAARHLAFLIGVRDGAHADGRRHARLARALGHGEMAARAEARLTLAEAQIEFSAAEYPAARERLARAREVGLPAYGERSAWAAMLENTAGVVELRAGNYEDAQAAFQRAVAIAEEAHGSRHPDVALPLNNLALAHERRARYDDAISALERARAVLSGAYGPGDPRVGQVLHNLGGMALHAGDPGTAMKRLQEAASVIAEALGEDHVALAGALTMLGEAALELGRHDEARTSIERALEIREHALGPDHPELSFVLVALARLDLAVDDIEAAHRHILRAAALVEGKEADPEDMGELRLTMARVLAARGHTDEAREEAARARRLLEGAGPTARRTLAQLDTWLDTLNGPNGSGR